MLDADKNEKRHEFKSTHCFRKFFETKCQSKMNHNNINSLMDHSLGESQNYHRPTEQELLDDYLHAVNNLTINEENRLKMKVEILESEKTDYKRLEAKLDAFQREFYKTNFKWNTGQDWEEMSPFTDGEIEQKIQERRISDRIRRETERRILEEIEIEKSDK
jgi:hypothetical protein